MPAALTWDAPSAFWDGSTWDVAPSPPPTTMNRAKAVIGFTKWVDGWMGGGVQEGVRGRFLTAPCCLLGQLEFSGLQSFDMLANIHRARCGLLYFPEEPFSSRLAG